MLFRYSINCIITSQIDKHKRINYAYYRFHKDLLKQMFILKLRGTYHKNTNDIIITELFVFIGTGCLEKERRQQMEAKLGDGSPDVVLSRSLPALMVVMGIVTKTLLWTPKRLSKFSVCSINISVLLQDMRRTT